MNETALARYRRNRREFFSLHGSQWPETLVDEFDILAPLTLSRGDVNAILEAARNIGIIYQRAAALLRGCSDAALIELGVPPAMLACAHCAIPGVADCVLGRLDMVSTPSGYKLLEFNTDSAGLVVEAFSVNSAVCCHEGVQDPNTSTQSILVHSLEDATRVAAGSLDEVDGSRPNVVVTSIERYRRDAAKARYLAQIMEPLGAQYLPVHSLRREPDGVYDPWGKRIHVLHRSLSLDHLCSDRLWGQPDSSNAGLDAGLLSLVERRRLALINPPFSFLLQNKALQALIWNLGAAGIYFDAQERRLIEQLMLPTYLDPPGRGTPCVAKPIYGSEGDGVSVFTANHQITPPPHATTMLDHQPMVYQEWVDVPALNLMTEFGRRKLHVVTSCFLLAGTPAGICVRAGERITDDSAWVLPVCCSL